MGCDYMKIEKVNDHQIRCTLTKADLADRELKISELAYGTEKAKSLFRDMMQQASYEFGFEAEDIPLMIEAIPLSSDCIVLIITKVEDPEELDTRFSKFAPSVHDSDSTLDDAITSISEGADDVLDLFKRLHEGKSKLITEQNGTSSGEGDTSKAEVSEKSKKTSPPIKPVALTKLYSFANFDYLSRCSYVLKGFYNGNNSLYKDPALNRYILTVEKSEHTPEEFNKVCNILSEYGSQERSTPACTAYCDEHYGLLISQKALQVLSNM